MVVVELIGGFQGKTHLINSQPRHRIEYVEKAKFFVKKLARTNLA